MPRVDYANSRSSHTAAEPTWWRWVSRAAMLILLSVVIARLLMTEQLRPVEEVFPGSQAAPIAPGPDVALALDLLAWVPALLVLTRRVLDRTYRLRASWAAAPMLALGAWALISTYWASDHFAALVSSMNWLSALVLFWAAVQLLRCWVHLRFVASLCVGLLITLAITGYYFRLVEFRDLKQLWAEHHDEIIREHHWEPNSFEANQFGKRVLNGNPMGFSTSTNTYAAILVLLGTVSGGLALQRFKDGANPLCIAGIGLAIAAALPPLWWTGCRAAILTSAAGGGIVLLRLLLGRSIERHSAGVYWRALAAIIVGAGLALWLGITRHTLLHDSLTFRWWYWVASARMFAQHPLGGVGWENFGLLYLGVRVPIAAEEIRDPHNFIVRIATELGGVGLVLLVGWMLAMWWELTQPPLVGPDPGTDRDSTPAEGLAARNHAAILIVATVIGGIVVNALASLDFASDTSYVLLEAARRGVFLVALGIGLAIGAIRVFIIKGPGTRLAEGELEFVLDDRPAPWAVYGILAALATFLLHNLIEFSLFEPGPMFLFALLAGAATGVREPPGPARTASSVEPAARRGRALAALALGGAVICWIAMATGALAPIAAAEALTHEADAAIRTSQFAEAAKSMTLAHRRVPYDAGYALRAAQQWSRLGDRKGAFKMLGEAIEANPIWMNALLTRANLAATAQPPDAALARADYERAARVDPNNVRLHQHFAELLEKEGDAPAAIDEYQKAIRANDGLSPYEAKRLKVAEVIELQSRIAKLSASPKRGS